MKYARLTLSLLAAGLLAACSSAPSTDGQGAAVEDRSSANASGVGGSGVTTVNADGRTPGAAYPELKDPKNILSKRSVLFDYDSYVIKDQYRPLVEAHAKFLVSHPKVKMLIQGNTDERGSRRLGRRFGGGVGLELAQAVVEIHVKILLPLDGVGQIVAEDFVLAAQAGDLGLQEFDLVGQLELGPGAGFELADAAVELVAHLVDAQAGFLVVKQAGVGLAGRKADEQTGHQRGQKAGEHQNSPE